MWPDFATLGLPEAAAWGILILILLTVLGIGAWIVETVWPWLQRRQRRRALTREWQKRIRWTHTSQYPTTRGDLDEWGAKEGKSPWEL